MSDLKVCQPILRFSSFQKSWSKLILGHDVAEIVGGGTPSTQESKFWNGDINWYSPTEIGYSPYAYESVKK